MQDFAELGSLLEGTPFGRPFEAAADPFFEHLREFMRGFERMAQGEWSWPCCAWSAGACGQLQAASQQHACCARLGDRTEG